MSATFLTRRCAAVSAVFVLACGAAGAAGSAAFADTAPVPPVATSSPAPGSSAAPTANPQSEDPTFTLTSNGAGTFSLVLTLAGTAITVDYTVDATGAVTAASTSTAGVSVTGAGHELSVTLTDGRAVKVELGDAGDVVTDVSLTEPNRDDNNAATGDAAVQDGQHGDTHDGTASPEPQSTAPTDSADQQGDNQGDDKGDNAGAPVTAAPQPSVSEQDQGDNQGDNHGDTPPVVVVPSVAPITASASTITATHGESHDQPSGAGEVSGEVTGDGGGSGSGR